MNLINIKLTLSLLVLMSFTLFAGEDSLGNTIRSFSANDESGKLWKLQDNLNQKYLIVYFYPAALTGG